MKKKSISTKLLIFMLMASIIGTGLVAVISITLSSRDLLEESLSKVKSSTASEAARINGWLTGKKEHMDALAIDMAFVGNLDPDYLRSILTLHTASDPECFDTYIGFPDGEGVFGEGWIPGPDWISYNRGWYKTAVSDLNKTHVTLPYTDAQTGELCISITKAVTKDGEVISVVSDDVFITTLTEVISGTSVGEGSYAFLVSADTDLLVHPNPKYGPDKDDNFQKLTEIENGFYRGLRDATVQDGVPVKYSSVAGVPMYYTAQTIAETGWRLYTAIPVSTVYKSVYNLMWVIIPVFILILVLTVVFVYISLKRIILTPITQITNAAHTLASGDIDVKLSNAYAGEMGELAESFQMIIDDTMAQISVAEALANGDLTVKVKPRSEKDAMNLAMEKMVSNLNTMFSEINLSAAQVSTGSKQIADGAQTHAQGATEQAAAVEQLSSSISEIAQKTKENASMAGRAANLAGTIKHNAEKGSHQMGQMMAAVNEINQASQSINKVIKVIDDIAFQTNILALNAAVEAARAGQHGKGFAVVAEEVRSLAAKSAEAAKDTGGLIANSMEKAELGARIADDTAASLAEIVSGINESTQIVSEIAKSSEEQSIGISLVNKGIEQVTQVVQQNSATAEESAAASEEMSGQSNILEGLISQFKLKGSDRHASLTSRTGSPKKTLAMLGKTTCANTGVNGDYGKY